MRSRLFTLLSAASLVQCVVTCALWVRSYWNTDYLCVRDVGGHTVALMTNPGGLWAYWTDALYYPERPGGFRSEPADAGLSQFATPFGRGEGFKGKEAHWLLGFAYMPPFRWYATDPASPSNRTFTYVAAPFWFLAAMFSAPPFLWVRRSRGGRRRARLGLCPSCGYDLRATPGRCPECGAMPVTKGSAA